MNFHELNNPYKQQPGQETEHYPRGGVFIFSIPAVLILCLPDGARTSMWEMDPDPPCKWTNKVVSPSCLGRCLGVILCAQIFSSGFCWEENLQFFLLTSHGYPKIWQRRSQPNFISYTLMCKNALWNIGIRYSSLGTTYLQEQKICQITNIMKQYIEDTNERHANVWGGWGLHQGASGAVWGACVQWLRE